MSEGVEEKYTKTLFYEVVLTGKYIKKAAEQHFKRLKLGFTNEEFSALDFIYESENICQRDLARRMFVNRANMGKILNGLENKGHITRTLFVKANRPVKLVSMTEVGKKAYLKAKAELKRSMGVVTTPFTKDEINNVISKLQRMRELTKNILKVDI